LFAARGYAKVRVDDITTQAGVSKGTFYNYFDSKPELLCSIVAELMAKLRANIDATMTALPEAPTELLRSVLITHVTTVLENQSVLRIYFREQAHLGRECRMNVNRQARQYRAVIAEVVSRGIEAGEFKSIPPTVAASNLLDICNGPYIWFSAEGEMTSGQVAALCADIGVDGLCLRDRPSRPNRDGSPKGYEALLTCGGGSERHDLSA
jgi:AcrR family transcriptional regulator